MAVSSVGDIGSKDTALPVCSVLSISSAAIFIRTRERYFVFISIACYYSPQILCVVLGGGGVGGFLAELPRGHVNKEGEGEGRGADGGARNSV